MSTLCHGEKRPNPSNPKGLGVNQDSPCVPHGRGEVLLEDRAKKMEEPRDQGKKAAAAAVRGERRRVGREGKKGRREITAGGLNTAVKFNCRYYRPKSRYHWRARDLRAEFCGVLAYRCYWASAGTTGRTGNSTSELNVANLEPNQS